MKRGMQIVWLVVLLLSLTQARADVLDFIYTNVDTYKVIDTWGRPGETVPVPIYFANDTLSVAGVYFRIIYETTKLTATGASFDSTRLEGLNWLVSTNDSIPGEVRFVGVDLFAQHFLYPGAGPIAFISFQLKPGFTEGETQICFEDNEYLDPPIQNSFADSAATNNYIPIKVCGYVRPWTGDNRSPLLDPIPGGNEQSVFEGDTLSFVVSGYDPDGDQITLYASGLPPNATFPTTNNVGTIAGTFLFTPNYDQGGSAYSVIFAIQDDGLPPLSDADTVEISVIEGGAPPPLPPIFSPQLPDQVVEEGDSLILTISAYDPNGDPVYFPRDFQGFPPEWVDEIFFLDHLNGTATFVFTPTYIMGPDTQTVFFWAEDNTGLVTLMDVVIEVVDKFDILAALSTGGSLPGKKIGRVPIQLVNATEIYGFEFVATYNHTVFDIDSVGILSPRLDGFLVFTNQLEPGMFKVLSMPFDLGAITVGSDIIMHLACTVKPDATFGQYSLNLTDALKVVDIYGSTEEMAGEAGYFTVDLLGDITLNGALNVGDAVALVAYVLGITNFDLRRQLIADVNEDSDVNVGDIVGIIGLILGGGSPGKQWPGGEQVLAEAVPETASVCVGSFSGEQGSDGNPVYVEMDNQTNIAGVQITLSYDADKLAAQAPLITGRSSGMVVHAAIEDGKMVIVMFSVYGDVIPSGAGPIIEIPFDVSEEASGNSPLCLEEVLLFDRCALAVPLQAEDGLFTVTPSGVSGGHLSELPQIFSLSSNHPNPFNVATEIRYTLPQEVDVRLTVYNVLGQEVVTLVDAREKAGSYAIHWDGRDAHGLEVSSGIYFYRINAGPYSDVKKMVMIK